MGKALKKLQKDVGKPADNKPVRGKSGRQTKTTVEKLQKYYGNSIRNNVQRRNLTPDQKKTAIQQIKVEIKGGLYHSCKLPDKDRHKYCPSSCAHTRIAASHLSTNRTFLNQHLLTFSCQCMSDFPMTCYYTLFTRNFCIL